MKKLQPVLDLISTLIVEQVEVDLASVSEQALGVKTLISKVLLKTRKADGLTVENIQVSVEKLQLPHPEDLNIHLTVVLENLDLLIFPEFWGRAARMARQAVVGKLGVLVDKVELRNVRIEIELSPAKLVDLRITMESCRVKLVGQLMQEVSNLNLEVLNFDLSEKDKKKALAAATVRLQDLRVRIMEITLNRAFDVVRDRIPSKAKLSNVDIALIEETMRLTIKTGFLPMAIPVELQMSTRDNLFGIYIVKIFIGLARPLILKAIQTFAAGKREITASESNIWINPWVKIPVALECRVARFCVENGALLIEFGQLPIQVTAPPPALTPAVEDAPVEDAPVEAQSAEEESAQEQPEEEAARASATELS
jgi:hypothetical protein